MQSLLQFQIYFSIHHSMSMNTKKFHDGIYSLIQQREYLHEMVSTLERLDQPHHFSWLTHFSQHVFHARDSSRWLEQMRQLWSQGFISPQANEYAVKIMKKREMIGELLSKRYLYCRAPSLLFSRFMRLIQLQEVIKYQSIYGHIWHIYPT